MAKRTAEEVNDIGLRRVAFEMCEFATGYCDCKHYGRERACASAESNARRIINFVNQTNEQLKETKH